MVQKLTSILRPYFIDFSSILGSLWGPFGDPFCAHFSTFSRFFRLLDALGPILGPSWALGGVLGAIFIDFSSILDAFWALLGDFFDLLGRSWGTF